MAKHVKKVKRKKVASKARKLLRSKKSSKKSVAGSALTQRASQVKSSAKTGKISRSAAYFAVLSVSKTRKKKK